MYYDLNVPWNGENQSRLKQIVKTFQTLGYDAIAFNHKSIGKIPKTKCPIEKIQVEAESGRKEPIRQYTRLTLVLDNPQQNYGINSNSEIVGSYDIIAVQPTTEKMFQVACATLDIDLITFDFTLQRPAFPIKHGFIRQALDRGISFEIIYGGMLVDPSTRKAAIILGHTINRVTKGRGVLVASGADSAWLVRAPADVMNLAGVLGVPAHLRKQSVVEHPKKCFEHAASRKHTHRTAVMIIDESKETTTIKSTTSSDMLEDFIRL